MDMIQVKVLNPGAVADAERMMVFTARLTQRGHRITNMADLEALLEQEYTPDVARVMSSLPHPTLQKFGVIHVAIVGASRRFLAQITRHQNEVKFMSASLQYSNYSSGSGFVVPYEILAENDYVLTEIYTQQCEDAMHTYGELSRCGLSGDTCGYLAPQALRGALIISATPYQWQHMISQRVCKRNTDETQYVMLKIWEMLYPLSYSLFKGMNCGPFCMVEQCKEGALSCKSSYRKLLTPTEILQMSFPALYKNR